MKPKKPTEIEKVNFSLVSLNCDIAYLTNQIRDLKIYVLYILMFVIGIYIITFMIRKDMVIA